MAAYVIMIREVMKDPAEFARYADLAGATLSAHPITPLAFYGPHEALEGERPDGVVILQFPGVDEAKAWYDSPAYQEAMAHRQKAADYRVIIVEGV